MIVHRKTTWLQRTLDFFEQKLLVLSGYLNLEISSDFNARSGK
jgi:hypothetical protein